MVFALFGKGQCLEWILVSRKYASDYMKRVEEFVLTLAGLRIAYESKGYMGVISKIMNKINRKILMSIRGGT